MEKLNINRDKPDLTDEQILKHKNFDTVLNTVAVGVTKVSWYKTGKFWLIGGSAIVVISAVIVLRNFGTKENTETASQQVTEIESDLENSIEEVDNVTEQEEFSFKEFEIGQNRIIRTRLGATIEMPFAVYGEVSGVETDKYTVRVTALPVPSSIELEPHSKIESFQIETFIADEKAAIFGSDAIEFIENDVHLLTYENGNWTTVEPLKIKYAAVVISDSTTSMIEPIKKSKKPFSFDASYGLNEQIIAFSELSGYKNIIFEPLEPQKEAFYDAEWNEVTIEKLGKGKYRLHLKLFDVEKTCDVRVVFDEKDFASALKIYNDSFEKEFAKEEKTESVLYLQNGGKYLVVYK